MEVNSLASKINRLPESKRREVVDFVEFLESHLESREEDGTHSVWNNGDFENMSVKQAMRGMEDESDIYIRMMT